MKSKIINRVRERQVAKQIDKTGTQSIRELAIQKINSYRVCGECICELVFFDPNRGQVNVEVAVTRVNGVPYAKQWTPGGFEPYWAKDLVNIE